MHLHVYCACTISTHLNLNLLLVAQNGIALELRRTAASQNCHSCQFAGKKAERGYHDDRYVALCSITALVCSHEICMRKKKKKEEDDEIQLFL